MTYPASLPCTHWAPRKVPTSQASLLIETDRQTSHTVLTVFLRLLAPPLPSTCPSPSPSASNLVVEKLEHSSKSPGSLLKAQLPGTHTVHSLELTRSSMGLEISIFIKPPGDAEAAGPGTML